jgi:hypothetical protein
MTKAISASEQGLKPNDKVRVARPGALHHLASLTEPKIIGGSWDKRVQADWSVDHQYGDTIGLINWEAITAIALRWTE